MKCKYDSFIIHLFWSFQQRRTRAQALSAEKILPWIHLRSVGQAAMKPAAQRSAAGSSGPKNMTSQAAVMATSEAPHPILAMIP